MKSEQQIIREQELADERVDTIRETHPHYDEPLAYFTWQADITDIRIFKDKILAATASPEALRQYLAFEGIDDTLYFTVSRLLRQLIERQDISEIDFVVARIVDFVQMCPIFYQYRFSKTRTKKDDGDPEAMESVVSPQPTVH